MVDLRFPIWLPGFKVLSRRFFRSAIGLCNILVQQVNHFYFRTIFCIEVNAIIFLVDGNVGSDGSLAVIRWSP